MKTTHFFYAIEDNDLQYLDWLMKRLGSEQHMDGDTMRDCMNRLFIMIKDLQG